MQNREDILNKIRENIEKIDKKEENLYFFVPDTKGVPSGALEYIYQIAYTLTMKFYNVTMLHNEKEFVGVGSWLGEEYAKIPHKNIETDNVAINPADVLFIPELYSNVVIQTRNLPCKRVIILQNFDFYCETMPAGTTPIELGVTDFIVNTEMQKKRITDLFPMLKVHIIPPAIQPMFRKSIAPKKLIVNIIAKNQSNINRIVKPFYWKYPFFKWVTFRDLRGLRQEQFAEALREGAITVWVDDPTQFGYSCLEALKCGSIVVAKTPEELSDWMTVKPIEKDGEESLVDSVLWFDDMNVAPDMVAGLVNAWIHGNVPDEMYKAIENFDAGYTVAAQDSAVDKVIENTILQGRKKDFEEVYVNVDSGAIKVKEEEEK